ncbi:MAG: hypothetical protein GF308_11340 [Candidatus Heimdallarchaeota archaeon]|nr:hypothetical protein [Candidatus Heimdallarchaeota archaeon]
MTIIVGIGIVFLVVLGSESFIFSLLGIITIITGLFFPFANVLIGKNTFEYKTKKPSPERKEKKAPKFYGESAVDAYDKDTLSHTVRSKSQY